MPQYLHGFRGPQRVPQASEFITWESRPLEVHPYDGFWCFNPSIHDDGQILRCAIRCADYGMPGGVQIRGPKANKHGGVTSRYVIAHLDRDTLRVRDVFAVAERDGLARNRSANRGYEDMRLFRTTIGGLQGIAAAAHLERTIVGDTYPPEQVIVSLDKNYAIIEATPIRGAAWGNAQKNWVPFDNANEPAFLYSISRGIVFDAKGPVKGWRGEYDVPPEKPKGPVKRPPVCAGPASNSEVRNAAQVGERNAQARQLTPTLIASKSHFHGLRGGTQLIFLGNNQWLGLGHEMLLVQARKYYWHTWYIVNSDGELTHTSPAMKLAREGIEFAAGMAIVGDRVIVSFGVDDAECRIAETSLPEVINVLEEALPPAAEGKPKSSAGLSGWVRRDADPSPTFSPGARPPVQRGLGYRPVRGPKGG